MKPFRVASGKRQASDQACASTICAIMATGSTGMGQRLKNVSAGKNFIRPFTASWNPLMLQATILSSTLAPKAFLPFLNRASV